MKSLYSVHWISIIFLIFFSCSKNSEKVVRPNILFAIADDVSYPHMGAYGCSWVSTPAFDRVAAAGLLFTHAYTPNAKCSPSRAIILTGRPSWQLEEAANHVPYFPRKFKTVWEALREHDYYTGHTAKGWSPGDPGTLNGQPRQLVGPAYNEITGTPPTTHISNIDYAGNFEAFLHKRPKNQPFSFWYGSLEPHRAYEYGSGKDKGGKKIDDLGEIFGFFPSNDTVKNDIMDYAFEIEHFDLHLSRMLSILEESGELDNTLVIVTADNGMPFPRVKGQVYERSNHLPLAIMWGKGIKNPGRTISEFVSFTDFAPTLLSVAGIQSDESGMAAIEGISLMDFIKDQLPHQVREYVIVGKERHDVGRPGDAGYPVRGIVTKDHLMLINFEPDRWPSGNPETGYLNCDGSVTKTAILQERRMGRDSRYWDWSFGKRPPEELYDLRSDPDCLNNLAGQKEHGDLLQLLKTKLLMALEQQNDPRVRGNGEIFDNYVYSRESHRNFYTRFKNGELNNESAGWVNKDDFEIIE